MEDYAANRKGKQPGTGGMFGTTPATTQSAGFNFGAIPANTGSRKSQIYSDFFYELHHIIYSYKYLESDLIKHCHAIFIHSLGQPLIVRSHSKVHCS
jgi:hypothetical protein